MTTFVDTNILVYLLQDDSPFHQWATEAVAEARRVDGPIVACDIVYSEFSVTMANVQATNAVIASLSIERLPFSDEALFRAGEAYKEHLDNGGRRSNVLSDFFVGAQAEVEESPLLTANTKDYVNYFPKVVLIKPPKAEAPANA